MPRKPQLHNTNSYQSSNGQWIARCNCGWLSRAADTETEALNEETDHVVAITRGER